MTTLLQQDGSTMTVTLAGTVSAGDVREMDESIGVYAADGVSGDSAAVLMTGVFTLDKETGVVFTAGDRLYWDATNDRLDKTSTNTPAGICWEDAATGDTSAKVSINFGAGG